MMVLTRNNLALGEVLDRLGRVLRSETGLGGLKPVHLETLRYLARANRMSRSPAGLQAWLGVTKGTVSQSLNVLERHGLVRRSAVAADGRKVALDLTAAAGAVLRDDARRHLDAALADLPESQAESLRAGLSALLSDLLKRRGWVAFGVCASCRHHRVTGPRAVCGLFDVELEPAEAGRLCVEHAA
jgi:DNA-binding MarR family transcriptional regulator